MSESSKGIFVGCTDSEVYVRVAGRGTFQNSQPLRTFSIEMLERGFKVFVIDLGQCAGMDSTFLGVLAGIGLRLRQKNSGGRVHVIHVSPRNLELLQTLGLDRIFSFEAPAAGPKSQPLVEGEYRQLPDTDVTDLKQPLGKNETTDLMLEAHTNLSRVDERNIPKFKDLTKFLRESVDRRRSEQKKQQD